MRHHIDTNSMNIIRGRGVLVAAGMLLAMVTAGCGGGGSSLGTNAPAGTAITPLETKNTYRLVEDTYGMQNATFMVSSRSQNAVVLRTAIASGVTDSDFRTVYRIDIDTPDSLRSAVVYSLDRTSSQAFPGRIYLFNGHQSTMLRTLSGTISFTSYGSKTGDQISGSFSALVEDGNSTTSPKLTYNISSDFSFVLDTNGALLPALNPVPETAVAGYDRNCASCHALGSHDTTFSGAGDLALKGGAMTSLFQTGAAPHYGITLSQDEVRDMKILLNAN